MDTNVAVFGAGMRESMGRTVHWQEMLRHEFLEALENDPVVILPVGSVEQHGPHCPMDVDISHTQALAVETALAIGDFPVIVAPPMWMGLTHYNLGEVGTITIGVETYIELLSQLCRSIWANGFRRIVVVNGHGGNRQIIKVVSIKLAEENIWMLPITFFEMVDDIITEQAGDRQLDRSWRRMGDVVAALSPAQPDRPRVASCRS